MICLKIFSWCSVFNNYTIKGWKVDMGVRVKVIFFEHIDYMVFIYNLSSSLEGLNKTLLGQEVLIKYV
jgi:hypothetical protein